MNGFNTVLVDSSENLLLNNFNEDRIIKYVSKKEFIIVNNNVVWTRFDPFSLMVRDEEINQISMISKIIIPDDKCNLGLVDMARQIFTGLLYSMYKFRNHISFADCLKMICVGTFPELVETFCIGVGNEESPDCELGWMFLNNYYYGYGPKTGIFMCQQYAQGYDLMLNGIRNLLSDEDVVKIMDSQDDLIHNFSKNDIYTGDVYVCLDSSASSKILCDIIVSLIMYVSREHCNSMVFLLEDDKMYAVNSLYAHKHHVFVSI